MIQISNIYIKMTKIDDFLRWFHIIRTSKPWVSCKMSWKPSQNDVTITIRTTNVNHVRKPSHLFFAMLLKFESCYANVHLRRSIGFGHILDLILECWNIWISTLPSRLSSKIRSLNMSEIGHFQGPKNTKFLILDHF